MKPLETKSHAIKQLHCLRSAIQTLPGNSHSKIDDHNVKPKKDIKFFLTTYAQREAYQIPARSETDEEFHFRKRTYLSENDKHCVDHPI